MQSWVVIGSVTFVRWGVEFIFPIDLRSRPYNTPALPCQNVICHRVIVLVSFVCCFVRRDSYKISKHVTVSKHPHNTHFSGKMLVGFGKVCTFPLQASHPTRDNKAYYGLENSTSSCSSKLVCAVLRYDCPHIRLTIAVNVCLAFQFRCDF